VFWQSSFVIDSSFVIGVSSFPLGFPFVDQNVISEVRH
jgi:hypothetical protein